MIPFRQFRRISALVLIAAGLLAATLGHGDPPGAVPVLDAWLRAELLVSPSARRLPIATQLRLQRSLRQAGGAGSRAGISDLGAILAPTAADPPLACFLTGTPDEARLREAGVVPGARANGVWSVRVPRSALARLLRVPGLATVQLAPPVRLLLDRSLPAAGADTLHPLVDGEFTGTTGRGVVVGIVDSGVDLTHPDFQRTDGASRILWAWDQTDTLGPRPTIIAPTYGTEWTTADIDAGRTRARDTVGHGTHVAGTAAGGGGPDRRYVGMAPGAELVVVGLAFDAASVVDGVDYVFRQAGRLGRPAVVNLSLGTQYGPHDGTSPFDRAIDGLTGTGRVVVAAAGNEAEDGLHGEILLNAVPPGGDSELPFVVPPYTEGDTSPFRFLDVDCWYGGGEACQVSVVTPSGLRLGPFVRGAADSLLGTADGHVYVGHQLFEGQSNFQLRLSNFSGVDPAPGTWRLLVRRLLPGDADAEFDAWIAGYAGWVPGMPGRRYSAPSFAENHDPSEEINAPATAPSVVAVGSLNSRFCWPTPAAPFGTQCLTGGYGILGGISPFSCRGPTRDGRLKPDVTAPGLAVIAPLSRSLDPDLRDLVGAFVTPDGEHWALGGTSMAAPHVTGAVALLLERFPGIRLSEVVERLRRSSLADAVTGPVYNESWGFGRLHVGRLLMPHLGDVRLADAEVAPTAVGVRVAWSVLPGSGETGFRLSRSAAPGAPPEAVWTFDASVDHVLLDREAPPNTLAHYRLEARMNGGELLPVAEWSLAVPPIGPAVLGPPLPNPSRGAVALDIRLPAGGSEAPWDLDLFDLAGRRVRRLGTGTQGPEARIERVIWDGHDDRGRGVAAGIYLARLRGVDFQEEQRIVRLP